jgi:hypothetical protein
MKSLPALAILFVMVATAPAVYAQSAESRSQRDAELKKWADDFSEWQQWWAQWANRPEPGWLTSSQRRRVKPEPPPWLADECAEVFDPSDSRAAACELLEQWRLDNASALIRNTRGSYVKKAEAEPKSIWWQYVHLDLLWPATEIRTSVYGVVGVHTAMTVKGRMQIFLAPGVMLVNVPAFDGTRLWKVAANYGFAYRLLDFNFPRHGRASLNVNIAKSWLMSDVQDLVVSRTADFVGFSINFKRH